MHSTIHKKKLSKIFYTIQVGAFSKGIRAANYCDALQKKGADAYYFIDKDGFYKVRIEKFENEDAANQRAMELESLGQIFDFFIVQPVSDIKSGSSHMVSLRTNIVQTARRFIGKPYQWGGSSPNSGFDCSGLTMTVYRLNGLALPRNSQSQFKAGVHISRNSIKKGDLVFFATKGRRVSHVGIYTGEDHFIHSPGRGKFIRSSSLNNRYFKNRFIGARRYF